MANSNILNIDNWTAPDSREFLSLLRQVAIKPSGRFIVGKRIAPIDLYSYLKTRFGKPNGPSMAIRQPSTENIIQWDYLIESNRSFLNIPALNTRMEFIFYCDFNIDHNQFENLIQSIKSDLSNIGSRLGKTRKSLDKWSLFINPYKILKDTINILESESNPLILIMWISPLIRFHKKKWWNLDLEWK